MNPDGHVTDCHACDGKGDVILSDHLGDWVEKCGECNGEGGWIVPDEHQPLRHTDDEIPF